MTNEEVLNFVAKERMINSQYGTIEDDKVYEKVMELLEKQVPKKPLTGTTITTYDNWTLLPLICPCCGRQVGTIEAYTKLRDIKGHFCSKCGQAIDWSE